MKLTPCSRLVIPALILGSVLLTQCTGDGSERKAEKERLKQQSRSEEIITARTMGLALLEENKLEDAEAEFKKLVSLAPDEAIGYANLGLVYLRTGAYDQAETNLVKALELTPGDTDIRLNLSTVYKYLNENELFIGELETIIASDPTHIQSLYRLAESYSGTNDEGSLLQREQYLKLTTEASPANIVPRLHLIEVLLRNDKPREARLHLEEIRRIFPEFSEDALEQYNHAFSAIIASDFEKALTSVFIFHNYLKLTNPYQNGISELKGYEGTSVGVPVFTFSGSGRINMMEGQSILEAMKFTDVTESAGLNLLSDGNKPLSDSRAEATHIAMGDFNHDDSDDLFVGTYLNEKGDFKSFMLKSEMGRFKDMTGNYDLDHEGEESHAAFTDFDNDGWFDLLVMNEGAPVLYRSVSEGIYENVSKKAFDGKVSSGSRALYFDMDHEGDLDLLISTPGKNILMRNNGDGTFSDYTESSGLAGDPGGGRQVTFGDFDDDGDIDLLQVNSSGTCQLFTNIREGRFRDISTESGLSSVRDAYVAVSGDYNNDGYLDLCISGEESGSVSWYLNTGKGDFEEDRRNSGLLSEAGQIQILDMALFDFDNDGFLDLLIAGDPGGEGSPGAFLLHNDGTGTYENTSHLLPSGLPGGRQIELADYNEDGDLDIFLAGLHGGVTLLRNDGGNANNHLKIKLKGIRTGSGKNNHYGIGAKIELRAGNHYQMKVVTEPNIYFGLADRSDVDVVRILWTNGTPQNIFTPGIEQDLIEEQQLKGSCPFLYAWNGEEYEFVKDIMWRSALGMPMGIMGKEQTYAFANASEDYHKIPGEMLKPKDGLYSIQVTEELWETIYLDKVQLIAVDHRASMEIYVDEQFVPPPYPPLDIHYVSEKIEPLKAVDGSGNDVLELILAKDNSYVSGFRNERYQGICEMHELIIDPGTIEKTDHLYLYLNGWIFPTDASINLALSQGDNEKVMAPNLQVINENGQWETVIENIGFPQGKNKTIIAELSGRFLSEDRRIRICTNMQIYWDYIFLSSPEVNAACSLSPLDPVSADHHFRGFSRMYRKGGPYGPHWFDYSTVSTEQLWRDLEGNYTRFGDVNELLKEPDNKYVIANAGDETTIEFDAGQLQELPAGWTRDFLIYSVGWVKDGDMNTAEGNRVGPLPYHGMTSYPYKDPGSYPDTRELKLYHKKYNTREVSDQEFRRAVFARD